MEEMYCEKKAHRNEDNPSEIVSPQDGCANNTW